MLIIAGKLIQRLYILSRVLNVYVLLSFGVYCIPETISITITKTFLEINPFAVLL